MIAPEELSCAAVMSGGRVEYVWVDADGNVIADEDLPQVGGPGAV